jgi:hypothetical protein
MLVYAAESMSNSGSLYNLYKSRALETTYGFDLLRDTDSTD